MRKIRTIVAKEWREVFKHRFVLFTVVFMPLMLTAIPLVILFTMQGSGDLAGLAQTEPVHAVIHAPAAGDSSDDRIL